MTQTVQIWQSGCEQQMYIGYTILWSKGQKFNVMKPTKVKAQYAQ